jgi:hypothetical protein
MPGMPPMPSDEEMEESHREYTAAKQAVADLIKEPSEAELKVLAQRTGLPKLALWIAAQRKFHPANNA